MMENATKEQLELSLRELDFQRGGQVYAYIGALLAFALLDLLPGNQFVYRMFSQTCFIVFLLLPLRAASMSRQKPQDALSRVIWHFSGAYCLACSVLLYFHYEPANMLYALIIALLCGNFAHSWVIHVTLNRLFNTGSAAVGYFRFSPQWRSTVKSAEHSSDCVDVWLMATGKKRINVIKDVRHRFSLSLREAADFVNYAPSLIAADISKADADRIMAEMTELGAEITTRPAGEAPPATTAAETAPATC